eukprot:TRINITY_DN2241_c0_g3_i2.p2 TRINITY_DN2241_c0_g3~~TRINITY_DN2241_c0_g3_i2.p2  ORF type:complete len:105 (-),score=17.75 TRINITY_DN2241_c0_g3_i2:623-937(-)
MDNNQISWRPKGKFLLPQAWIMILRRRDSKLMHQLAAFASSLSKFRENLTLARINFALTASESGLKEKTLALNAGGASIVFAKSGKESITVSQNERKCKSTLEI